MDIGARPGPDRLRGGYKTSSWIARWRSARRSTPNPSRTGRRGERHRGFFVVEVSAPHRRPSALLGEPVSDVPPGARLSVMARVHSLERPRIRHMLEIPARLYRYPTRRQNQKAMESSKMRPLNVALGGHQT